MLPPKALKLFVKYLRLCSILNLFPFAFCWDKENQNITVKHSTRKRITYWTVELGMFVYQIFLLYRAKKISEANFLPLSLRVKALYMMLSFAGMIYNRFVIINHQDELTVLISNFVNIPRQFAVAQGCVVSKDKVSKMIRIIVAPSMILATLNILVAFAKPEAPHHISSLLRNPKNLSMRMRLLFTLLQGYINASQYLTAAFNLILVVVHIEAILPMMRGLRLPLPTSATNSKLLPEDKRVIYYHQLRTLQALFNSVFSYWVLGAQAYFMIAMVVNNFQAVIFFSLRGLLASIILTVLCSLIFKHLGHVWENSTQTLNSWTRHKQTRLFQKFHRSFRPLKVKVSSFYYADYKLVMVILTVVLSNSGGLIVAYKDMQN